MIRVKANDFLWQQYGAEWKVGQNGKSRKCGFRTVLNKVIAVTTPRQRLVFERNISNV